MVSLLRRVLEGTTLGPFKPWGGPPGTSRVALWDARTGKASVNSAMDSPAARPERLDPAGYQGGLDGIFG